MFTHYITSINYARLIELQANQETFISGNKRNRKQMLKFSNKDANFSKRNQYDKGSKVKKIGRIRESKRK